MIQDIYELASDVLKKAQNTGFAGSEGYVKRPIPDTCDYQTKQGFVLYNLWKPSHIATPFGKITIYDQSLFGYSPFSVTEEFIKRLNAVFEGVVYNEEETEIEVMEIPFPSGPGTIKELCEERREVISENELASKQGTQSVIIVSPLNLGNHSLYKIREVKGKQVPEVIHHESEKSMRKDGLIMRIWEMLEADRLGRDPIAKKIRRKKVIKHSTKIKKSS